MWLPSGSTITAHQLFAVIGCLPMATVAPAAWALAMVSSIESTSTYERGWVNP